MRHAHAGVDTVLPTLPVWGNLAKELRCAPGEVFGFHVAAVCHAQRLRTDGVITTEWLHGPASAFVSGPPVLFAYALVEAGLWMEIGASEHETCWSWKIVGFERCNTTRAEWEAHRTLSQIAGKRSAEARATLRTMQQQVNQPVEPAGSESNQPVEAQPQNTPGKVNQPVESNQPVGPGNQPVAARQPAGCSAAVETLQVVEPEPVSSAKHSAAKVNRPVPRTRAGVFSTVQQVLPEHVLTQDQDLSTSTSTTRAREGGTNAKRAKPTPADLQTIWNLGCGALPKWIGMPAGLEKAARARLKELPDLDQWRLVVITIATSPFCGGRNKRKWRAGPAFLLRELTWSRALNGEIEDWSRQDMDANERRKDIAARNARTVADDDRITIIRGEA